MVPQIVILKSESDRNFNLWLEAIHSLEPKCEVSVIDVFSDRDWKILSEKKGGILLATASGRSQWMKRVYDEKVWVISQNPNWMVYPPVQEIFLFENKKLLRDWLLIHDIPHPRTSVFFHPDEAKNLEINLRFPVVVKTNIGASGSGVKIIHDLKSYQEYCTAAFGVGLRYKSGPKWFKGSIFRKLRKVISNPRFISQRLNEYKISKAEVQRDMLFVQEFIPHQFEWRCVVIGDSYFAHKKIAVDNMSSGTLIKGYDKVPFELLEFIHVTMKKTGLISACIDVFESDGGFLVNEVQTFFGQSDPYQMIIDDAPGRYVKSRDSWIFEAGDFNRFENYLLRFEHALSLWNLRS
ncbi:MAG: hypothetical protein FJX95_05775 [Bacteroidetes bacterium]|nr:hypothetical protein [Bacteroidota bacterium]